MWGNDKGNVTLRKPCMGYASAFKSDEKVVITHLVWFVFLVESGFSFFKVGDEDMGEHIDADAGKQGRKQVQGDGDLIAEEVGIGYHRRALRHQGQFAQQKYIQTCSAEKHKGQQYDGFP